jgi:hypothetical protein
MLTRNNSSAASRPHENVQSGETSRSNSHRAKLTVPANSTEGLAYTPQPDHLRRPRDGAPDKSAVVRRTIIFPSESRSSTIDLSVLIRKHSSRRRRASATSVSSRSVHDRAPTPPPARANTGRRFSTDITSPPVPQLPQSLPLTDRLLIPATQGPVENPSSAYDSLSVSSYIFAISNILNVVADTICILVKRLLACPPQKLNRMALYRRPDQLLR